MLTVGTFTLVAAPLLPVALVYGIVALIGAGYAGQQLFGLAMLPDCIAYNTVRRQTPGRRVHQAMPGGGDLRPGPRPRHLRCDIAGVRFRPEHVG